MRQGLVSFEVGVMLLVIWIAVVGVLVVGYYLLRSWRRRHPAKAAASESSYSEKLERRLAQGRKKNVSARRKR